MCRDNIQLFTIIMFYEIRTHHKLIQFILIKDFFWIFDQIDDSLKETKHF